MIEIVLDENKENEFLNRARPVYQISNFQGEDLKHYRSEAKKLIAQYKEEEIVIVRNSVVNFSLNKFALALFIESCLCENNIECVVLKVEDSQKATQAYKPYVALCIALKFVMRLCHEPAPVIYKEISDTGYLGLAVNQNYADQTITLSWNGKKKMADMQGKTPEEALIIIGILKTFSLAKLDYAIHAEIKMDSQKQNINQEKVISTVCRYALPYLPF